MQSQTVLVSKNKLWTGRVFSALVTLLLLFSSVLKLLKPVSVVQGFAHYGYPENLTTIIAILELLCALIYAIPRTSILGAILLTGYLGGATASNVRVGDPSYLITVALGVLVWVGLYLREDRLPPLIPLRR